MPGAGACPRPDSVPRAGSRQPWLRASMALVGRDGRWEELGHTPRMLYPGGWPREWGFPLCPAHFLWLFVPPWSEAAGLGAWGLCLPRAFSAPGTAQGVLHILFHRTHTAPLGSCDHWPHFIDGVAEAQRRVLAKPTQGSKGSLGRKPAAEISPSPSTLWV